MSAASSEITYGVDGPVATVTLNRPQALNAWTDTMDDLLRDAVTRAAEDPAVVGIVITGAGRAFCAGADMGMLQGIRDPNRDVQGIGDAQFPERMHPILHALPLDQFHREVEATIVFSDGIAPNDMGMIELGHRLGFADEAFDEGFLR